MSKFNVTRRAVLQSGIAAGALAGLGLHCGSGPDVASGIIAER